MMMKKVIYFILMLAAITVCGNIAEAQSKFTKGKISGIVIDKSSGSPLENATVQLFRMKDSSLVTGGATEASGTFLIENIPGGRYNVLISFIGYNNINAKNIAINSKSPEVDLGTLKMSTSNDYTTEEIEVTSEKPLMEMDFDKKVYNVEKNLVTQSGTATDVLKNIPSVSVDADGNVSVRGSSNVRILINGKPSSLLGGQDNNVLDQIPSDNIEKVEVINNPSARYDAEGDVGIINIVLKQQQDIGYNGTINLNAGTGDKYNTSINLNLRKGNIGFFANYSFRSNRDNMNGNSFRENFLSDSLHYLLSDNDGTRKGNGNFISTGFDYDINKLNNLYFTATYGNRSMENGETTNYNNYNINFKPSNLFYNRNQENNDGNNVDLNLNYKLKFTKPKQELNVSAQYSHNRRDETQIYTTQQLTNDGQPANLTPDMSRDESNNKYTYVITQADYYQPLGEDNKLEFGYKTTYRDMDLGQTYSNFDYNLNQWTPDLLKNNEFFYKDYVHALYGIAGFKYKDLGIQAGVRYEYTQTKFHLANDTKGEYSTNYSDFFPSLSITQKFFTNNEFIFNYSRRINRPGPWNLNPFIDYSDPLNLRSGNPYVKPEYMNAYELGYVRYFSSFSFTTSVFYRNTSDGITRFTSIDSSGVSYNTVRNIASKKSYGVEAILQGSPFKWWTANINFSYYRSEVNGNDGFNDITNSAYNWSMKMMQNFSFKNLFDVQMSYFYSGKMMMLQGSLDPFQSLDIAIKKDFFNKKFSISFRVQDIFNSQKFSATSTGYGFYSDFNRRRDSRVASLTLTYRFGTDMEKRNKNKKPEQENNNNNDEQNMDY